MGLASNPLLARRETFQCFVQIVGGVVCDSFWYEKREHSGLPVFPVSTKSGNLVQELPDRFWVVRVNPI